MRHRFLVLGLAALLLAGCHGAGSNKAVPKSLIDYTKVSIPDFDADSAYGFVADQVACGFRTPGSEGQKHCAEYLVRQMRRWCDTVMVQEFSTTLWDGKEVRGKNIIATINAKEGSPEGKRVLLAAHWDSRMWADHDADKSNHHKPFDGANDGASGVGVLMELARAISSERLTIPIDFIFFDVEDQGTPDWADSYDEESWCKGSQHWSNNPHVPFYTATYGVLLDMVGTEQPRYTREQISREFAGGVMNKLWAAAAAMGYGNMFLNNETAPILDDHYYVNRIAGIPMVDIVQNSPGCSFFKHWHTTGDNMSHVDRNSLKAVGVVLLKTLYGDYGIKD